jgi:hypothetical protein
MSKVTVRALRTFWDNENRVKRNKGELLTISEAFYKDLLRNPVDFVSVEQSYPKSDPIKEEVKEVEEVEEDVEKVEDVEKPKKKKLKSKEEKIRYETK